MPAPSRLTPDCRLGLGTAAIGRPAYLTLGHRRDLGGRPPSVAELERQAHAVLDEAMRLGVGYIDCARSYGRAEEFVAGWLGSRSPETDDMLIGSKWGYTYVADWDPDAEVHEIKDHSLDTLRRQIAESRSILGNRLDLYQIHSAGLEVLDDPAVLEVLAILRDAGLAIGLSTSGPEQSRTILAALSVEVDGSPLFSAVQSTWNLLEPSAGPALAAAHQAGLTVIVKEALANGRLTTREPETSARLGSQAATIALAAALTQPWADIVLSGAATPAQLRSNAAALDLAIEPDAFADMAEPAPHYWQHRSGLPWQ